MIHVFECSANMLALMHVSSVARVDTVKAERGGGMSLRAPAATLGHVTASKGKRELHEKKSLT